MIFRLQKKDESQSCEEKEKLYPKTRIERFRNDDHFFSSTRFPYREMGLRGPF